MLEIVDLSDEPEVFFDLLPTDWLDALHANWSDFKPSTYVFGIKKGQQVIGGGLVFSEHSNETDNYPQVSKYYFSAGFLYIGYLWVAEDFRGQNIGDFWLNSVFNMFPQNPFWLSIEDAGLAKFYLRNGFTLEREMIFPGGKDWIYVRKPVSELI